MTGIAWLVYYVLMLGLAVPIIRFAHRLSKYYPYKYLEALFYYLITVTFYTFLVYMVPDMLVIARGENNFPRDSSIYWICDILAFPLIPIYINFFIRFFFELVDKKVPSALRRWLYIFSALLLVLYGFGFKEALLTGNSYFFKAIYHYLLRQPILIFRFALIVYAAVQVKSLPQIPFRRAVRLICAYYFITLLIHLVLPFLPQTPFIFYARPFFFLGLNLPPLIYLSRFLNRHALAVPLSDTDSGKLNRLCSDYGVSPREQEILLLLLNGRSNQEIENELFISIGTVKSHVYNLYQKFGVNSRLKLANLIRKKSR